MSKVEQIQSDIDSKNAAIEQEAANGQQTNHEQIIQWRNEISVLQMQLSDAKTEEANQQERVQAQTEKVESITLPLDFNDLLDNPLANEMIIEVVKQFQLQAYDEHNVEVARINAECNTKINAIISAADEREGKLYRQNKELNDLCDSLAKANAELHLQSGNDILAREDAESKRDAAARELEQALTEIERLKQPKAQSSLDINGNDKLNELAKQAKESIVEKANRGLARWNLPAIEVPSMPAAEATTIPEIPAAQEEHPKDEVSAGNTEGNTTVEGNTDIPQGLGASTKEETPVTLESLHERVKVLEAKAAA